MLLAVQHDSEQTGPLTAEALARVTGLHRVTAQRILSKLQRAETLIRRDGRLTVQWDRLANG